MDTRVCEYDEKGIFYTETESYVTKQFNFIG